MIRTFGYCVISFVLNRIYTEWYKRKGKSFDITNDPVYDQEFLLGTTIAANISEGINSMFNTYVVKGRQVQPMLTQYSDGIKVVRDGWLSMWQSKFMVDNGANPLEILRKYYGDNVTLQRTSNIEGIPEAYPGNPLVIGSTGKTVRVIQEYINRISSIFTPIPKVTVNGNYDLETAEAVKQYQRFFKLKQTGIVDFGTWYSLARLYVQISQAFDRGKQEIECSLEKKFIPPVIDKNKEYIPIMYYPTS
ncbi:peptidoglycan-binding domain-containing protein [Clostridium cellulovorans]|uniref:peptidoglycan-binding domain-containing protein n=1 Tax=Clostridium cellulovorans TaxID=1493 RepID=UPI0001A96D83|nr:peptidoglycan-binding domain-containing protein [Clostridium cellulovorans]